jgi:glutamyl-tRNA synthetase
LFNYLLAKQAGGTFLLRIEDTDRARHDESAVEKIIEDLRWLGLEWNEGVEIGGDNGPYRQSERLEIYTEHIGRLLDAGHAYYAFETSEELDAMRTAARAEKRNFRYPRPDSLPYEVFGEVTVAAAEQDDFIIAKTTPKGQAAWPTYHLANVVDDALMGVNFVCRGQEFLSQTWRHVLLREAFGFDEPAYAHLPLIMDMAGRKLSKRDGDVEVHAFRTAGYLPEALVNFIALLGWNPGDDRERLTMSEMIESFSVDRIGKANAKFDREKLLAFNTDAVADADEGRLLAGFKDYLSLNETSIPDDDSLLLHLLRINKGFRTFADIPAKCGVLFAAADACDYDEKAVKKVLAKGDGAGYAMLEYLKAKLADCEWTEDALQALIESICAEKSVGMGKVAQPIRVAVTGTTVSPAIYDTLMILGRDKTLARIDRCLATK